MSDARADRKQRSNNACDQCKRRKIRCDSNLMPNNVCSSCLSTGVACTHKTTQQKRGPKPGSSRAVLSQSVKDLIAEILKGTDSETCLTLDDSETTKEIIIKLVTRIKSLEVRLAECRRKHHNAGANEETSDVSESSSFEYEPLQPQSGEEADAEAVEQLSREMASFTLAPSFLPKQVHFGEASNMMLVVTALDHRRRVDSNLPEWRSTLKEIKRPQFWELPSWLPIPQEPDAMHFEFPDRDELRKLVDTYFAELSIYCPLVHRPSFERSLSEGLHLRDNGFGAVVLAICAVASGYRYEQSSTDNYATIFVKSGMKWFKQLPIQQFSLGQDVSLYRSQMYCLVMHYIQNLATGRDVSNIMSAIVIKIVQERRAQRHAALDARDPGSKMEAELWKRVLWTLLMIDMKVSMIFGSPRGIPTYGFDLEHLIECDDEYWEHDDPNQAFIQPPGKPSSVAYWNHYVKLVKITTFAHDVLFSEHDWQPWKRMGISSHAWKQKAVIEIDSDLNKWVESIPDHLRWDPHTQNEIFLAQSSVLYTTYYWLQIQIHRRFIPRPGQKPLLSFPSLAICSNAARACVHIAESCLKRIFITHPHFLIPLSSSAIVLAVNIWRGKRVDSDFNPQNDLLDINRCITLLRLYESRFTLAGRLIDIINTVMTVSQGSISPAGHQSMFNESQSKSTDQQLLDLNNYMSQPHPDPAQDLGTNLPFRSTQLGQIPLMPHSRVQPSLVTQSLGYQHDVSRDELAIFEGIESNHYIRESHKPPARSPNGDSQDHDWDVFMASVDQLLSTMEGSKGNSEISYQ